MFDFYEILTYHLIPFSSPGHSPVWCKFRKGVMKEVQTKPEGDQKIINESKENAGTFLRIHLCIKGFSIIDWVYHFTSKKKLKEK